MKDFEEIRNNLTEEITFRDMAKRVVYASRPARPSKRVSRPTREMILKLKSYQKMGDAAKDRGLFNRAKEVCNATLSSMDTKLYVRELRSKGGFLYFVSFNDTLPNMVVEVDKKIPKNDWQYFPDEYQYATYVNFQKRFVDEDNEGKAGDVEGGNEEGIDPSYVSKTGKSIAPKIPRSFSMTGSNSNAFEITNDVKYDFADFREYSFDPSGAVIEQLWPKRYGTVEVEAPSLRQVMKKLSKEGKFYEDNWEMSGWDEGSGDDAEKMHVVKGPNGILPKSDAYNKWLKQAEEQIMGGGDPEQDISMTKTIIIQPPYRIKDMQTGGEVSFDPENDIEFPKDPKEEEKLDKIKKVELNRQRKELETTFKEDEKEWKYLDKEYDKKAKQLDGEEFNKWFSKNYEKQTDKLSMKIDKLQKDIKKIDTKLSYIP